MYNTALRIINKTQDAEDIMQEAFMSAFENLNKYNGEVAFGAWLKRIVINKSIDYLRKQKVNFENIEDYENQIPNETETGEWNSETGENKAQLLERIKKHIEELDNGYRVVLSLYLLEGYDHDEIAQILDIRPSTSRSQFSRAKKILLKKLTNKK